MPTVSLGNEDVLEPYKPDPGVDTTKVRRRKDLGRRVTTVSLPPLTPGDPTGWTFEKWLSTVTSMWPMHSDKPPAWVECDDPALQQVVAAALNCREGRPKNWKVG